MFGLSKARRNAQKRGVWSAMRGVAAGAGAGALGLIAAHAVIPAASIAGAASPAFAVPPEPNPVPTRWEFDFKPGPLRIITVSTDEGPKRFFYLTWEVANYTGEDRLLAPSFDLVGDDGAIYRAGRNVPPAVTREIMRRLRNPGLDEPSAVVGNLLQGEEHARETLAVWPAEDLQTDEVTVFAAGFSGESEVYRAPDPDSPDRYRNYTLRKTLMLEHETPGDLSDWDSRPFPVTRRQWILR